MEFEQIVLKYQNLVYTVCHNILKNPHDAENAAQETFLSAYLDISKTPGNARINDLKSWLCKIAANKSVDFRRRNCKIAQNEQSFEILEFGIGDKANVENQAEQKERAKKLHEVISAMPEKYANAIKAFYFEQMSVKEIAKHYSLPEKTVETHLYRAKKMIKERWCALDNG
jgi:RNA polymerase sigma-70 factor (ECF subfamily)